ncbi:MAG TPA: ATP-binding protein [Acidobacteriota bacterium]|nr:ATP-binding protein [Acidobacteriota bacterium]HNB73290.1 ATP-binding protein [Acidobacteriota bacterium]HND20630.1 ATP-binding protein [Acidobacteriota bacterium]HNG94814.1 ATP-binding protein [Acidobacteriota bacterium]HNH82189.1 ATP-binding protein [Acidobacteriota bacterium]
MSLRFKFLLYLILAHVLFAVIGARVFSKYGLWVFAVEGVFVISLVIGLRLVGELFNTLNLIRSGAQFIKERDFTTKIREVGQPELDQLVAVYNRMIDSLREERLRLQENNYFLEKVLSASPSGILTLDFDNRISMVNPAAERLLQAEKSTLIGLTLEAVDSTFTRELGELKPGEARVIPYLGRRKVKCHKSEFIDRGFPRHFIVMEELTEELRQTEKAAYEKLIRLMSHEVNNTIGAANSLLHSCLNYKDQLRPDDQEDYEMALQVVIDRTDQLNAFMRSFADVVRLSQPKREACEIQVLLETVARLLKVECESRAITLTWEIEAQLGRVNLDRGQIEQVLVNLMKNAIEAIGENGRITIRTGKNLGRPFVTIEDTGAGFPPEVKANLFSPFFSTKEHGQGIGLTLVQEILDNHGFDFALESEPGSPTRFTLFLSQKAG